MNFISRERPENSAYIQLLILIVYAIVGVVVSVVIAFVIIAFMLGTKELMGMQWLTGSDAKYVSAMRVMISTQQVGLFLLPALLLAVTEGKKQHIFYGFKRPSVKFLGLVILIMICAMPALEWIGLTNQKMVLPGFMKSIELWMKQAEESAAQTTMILLKMDHFGIYLLNLAMIGLLPAICEEMMFRGAIQRCFGKMFKNPHVAIWFSAFLFSAIHMQFYGFFPRLLLGAGFGYIYFWTGSLWYTIFAHFLNNAYAVTTAWYMQKNNIPLSQADQTSNFAWYGYVISGVFTICLFIYFKNKVQQSHEQKLD